MKRLFMLALLLLLTLSACKSPISQPPENTPYFTGKVIEKYADSCLLEVTDTGNGHLAVGQQVVVATGISDCPPFSIGDYLTIYFDGKIAQSFPPQIFNVLAIQKQ